MVERENADEITAEYPSKLKDENQRARDAPSP